jgi:2'-5' RNA ligase
MLKRAPNSIRNQLRQTELKRLFLGTFLSDEDKLKLKEVRDANENLPESFFRSKVRWVNDQKLHLTWLFLGDLEDEVIDKLQSKLALVLKDYQSNKKELLYDHLEIWFARGLPRHLVLAPSFVAPDTLKLIEQIRAHCAEFVHEAYQAQAVGQYRPHITLLRFEKDGTREASPPFLETPGSHPLTPSRKVKTKTIAPDGLNKIASFLPFTHHLSTLAIIESKRDGSAHGYSILRSFDLT